MRRRVPKITKICKECGMEYEVFNYEKDKRIYCSRTCASRNFNRKRNISRIVSKNCLYCNEHFTRKVHNNKPDPKYCCTDCANKHRVVLRYGELQKESV